MGSWELQMCDIQGRLFVLAVKAGYELETFCETFMRSRVAGWLDEPYNRMQWAGEEYLLEEIQDAAGDSLVRLPEGQNDPEDVAHWMGYLCRFWHFFRNESSQKIIETVSAHTMRVNWLMFHTMDPELAVEEFEELALNT